MRQLDYISLIHKEMTGELSPEESVYLSKWLTSSNDNVETYEDVKAVWHATSEFKPVFEPNVDMAFKKHLDIIKEEDKIDQPKVIRMIPARWIQTIAAGLVILVSTVVILNNDDYKTISANQGNMEYVLNDGTKVFLHDGSRLKIHNDFNAENRNVNLSGEAYFDVVKDESLPFHIEAGELSVKVLGTAFNVRNTGKATPSVMVERGKVQVSSNDSEVILTPGQYVKLEDEILKQEVAKDLNEINWMKGYLSFDGAPMSDIFEDLESYFNVDIVVKDNFDYSCPYTFTRIKISNGLEVILQHLEKSLDMEYEIVDDKVIISSMTCN